jgi:hypothetical protein
MTTDQPLLGRCKECDFALFATRDQVINVDDFRGIKNVGLPHRVGNNGLFARCPNRHKVFVLKQIKGTYSKDHKCDARCLEAKGHKCTCSCGGLNHGRGYAVETVEAAPQIVGADIDEATEKQLALIKKLIVEKLDSERQDAARHRLIEGLDKKLASAWIEKLLAK